jgi:CHASE2 domain-containing sensor protein
MAKAADKASKRAKTDQPATESCGCVRRLQLFVDTAERFFQGLGRWLTHDQKHLRVLAWIICLFVLFTIAGVLIVLLFRWEPLHTILLIGCSTGAIASMNFFDWLRRRMK